MQATWSLMLNVLLLVGVVSAIVRTLKVRRRGSSSLGSMLYQKPSLGDVALQESFDDVIAVRKVELEPEVVVASKQQQPSEEVHVMMFLLAKANRHFAGYELLQTLLAAGLRFGEGSLFHRHQHANGQGPILCSLACATSTGVFDMQSMGAFSVRGLCLFMQASGNPTIDGERFNIMLDTARLLSEGLDAHLLDDARRPLTDERIQHYIQLLGLDEQEEVA